MVLVLVVPFNKSWLKIPPPTLDTPNWPAAACAGAYEAPVEREARLAGQAIPTSGTLVGTIAHPGHPFL